MGELYDFVRAASEKLGIPPEILSGLPVVEQHRGISAYSEQAVCIKANFGTVCVEGEGLTIRMMDREKLIVYGMIRALRLERRKP